MSPSERQYYAECKLLELEQIGEMYNRNGGRNGKFRKILEGMKQFYREMGGKGESGDYPGVL
jgi:hypothetical protein